MPDDGAVNGSAVCVDCRREVPDEWVFRVLRTDRAGRRHVVCQDCGDRKHAEARPAPLQVQRTVPSHMTPSGNMRLGSSNPPGDED